MSPFVLMRGPPGSGFPRVSGDEPLSSPPPLTMLSFSPRERG